MLDFEYYAPTSLEEALSLLDERKGEAKILAGGTDLIVQMKDGRARPAVVIDVKNVPDLNRLGWDEDGAFHIGAAVPLSKIVAFPTIRERFSVLHQACSLIGSVQIRNRGTLGGNICNAAPSADSAPPLLCLGAKAVVARSKGISEIPLRSFFQGPGRTILTSNGILVGIKLPVPPAISDGCYLRLTPREEMDIGVVGVASFLVLAKNTARCREAKIALGAVAPTPIRAVQAEAVLKGEKLTEPVIEEAAEKAAQAAEPISDVRGSAGYRREMVKALTKRTLKAAWEACGSKF